nr:MAG TPA: hypothetical protein [Caudoviricetes sp.]
MDNKQRLITSLKQLRTEVILNRKIDPSCALRIEGLIREVQAREEIDYAEIGEYRAMVKGILRRAELH